jgi:hypothetical protein
VFLYFQIPVSLQARSGFAFSGNSFLQQPTLGMIRSVFILLEVRQWPFPGPGNACFSMIFDNL